MHSVRCDSLRYDLCLHFRRESSRFLCTQTSHFLSVLIFRIDTELGKGDLSFIHPGSEAVTDRDAICQGSLLMLHWDLEVQGTRAGQRRKCSVLFSFSLSYLFCLHWSGCCHTAGWSPCPSFTPYSRRTMLFSILCYPVLHETTTPVSLPCCVCWEDN